MAVNQMHMVNNKLKGTNNREESGPTKECSCTFSVQFCRCSLSREQTTLLIADIKCIDHVKIALELYLWVYIDTKKMK